jgi:hypothetical protein
MSQYTEARKRIAEANEAEPETHVRTDYRCRANGCPNTGCIDDDGVQRRGRCYWHWRETDPLKWDAITQKVRANFETMRNHGKPLASPTGVSTWPSTL